MAKIRLVFADKEGGFREGLARLLENEPTVELVCICGTGLEAVDSAYKHRPDVVLIDLRLSECSSVEAIQRIHEGLPKTNIIVLTHPEADDDLVSAARAGAKAYISKDISIETLVKAITLVADGGGRYIRSDGNKTAGRIWLIRGEQGCREVVCSPE